ncbi:hypothetical protein PR003_g7517 [Phytophthora rubi]|uniref:Uncharacterized protein n=1 Tax=Phytophthora rubi TaxID=129364 RepID=A0A6A4FXW1_9STRA|nr:hypothetical protein PR003_g7517 [Phytophthora rubi]
MYFAGLHFIRSRQITLHAPLGLGRFASLETRNNGLHLGCGPLGNFRTLLQWEVVLRAQVVWIAARATLSDDGEPDAEVESEVPIGDVDLSTINDPAATAAAFASVGQLLVTQQVISAATAKCIFQGELNLERSDSAVAADVDSVLPGDVPPARFGVRQDPSGFVVGVSADHADLLSEHFMRDGYGGLETLIFVETLSDEDIQDLSEITNSRLSIRPELLLPRSADSAATVPGFCELLGGMDASRELTSLL